MEGKLPQRGRVGGKEDPPRQARRCCYAVARSQGEERRGEGEGGREVEREEEEG